MIFWKLTFLMYFLGIMFGGSILTNALDVDKKSFIFVALCFFGVCMGASNLLIDVLASYGVKTV